MNVEKYINKNMYELIKHTRNWSYVYNAEPSEAEVVGLIVYHTIIQQNVSDLDYDYRQGSFQ